MKFLTDFADQAVVLPLAVAILAVLLGLRWFRGAFAWTAAVCFTLGTILVLKIVCTACATHLAITGLQSPSGHTASACLVYGGLFVLLDRRPSRMLPALLLAAGLAFIVGSSRIALHAHTLSDVAVGAVVGLAGVFVLVALAGPRPPLMSRWPLGAAVLAIVVIFHGVRLPAEDAIRIFALSDWIPFLAACRA